MEVANTLAYYDTATITAVKSFIVQAPVKILIYEILENIYSHSIKLTNFSSMLKQFFI